MDNDISRVGLNDALSKRTIDFVNRFKLLKHQPNTTSGFSATLFYDKEKDKFLGVNLQIPIYSKLKAKLESKGIDNISSGQIAWFVCSVGIFIIPMVYFYISNNYDQFTILFFMLFIFILNMLYIKNFFALLLLVILIFIYMKYHEFIYNFKILFFIFAPIIFIFLRAWRILITFLCGYIFLVAMVYIFELLGGFYK
ncbi:hypothetical protein CSUB8523_1068 [Campylobacter subantarcticus LMG 24377]|uniref:hypothetical protein n=2 Tax=Campylobacter subantarcticus TaxID=497724 RepID=UPI000581FDFE|nr:hypothetical protein [Campylobacter subantarcticus]AJC92578.1 hypothetical protein CSUB8523_1068 [Campylobacter subantarcticus LMG 24377]